MNLSVDTPLLGLEDVFSPEHRRFLLRVEERNKIAKSECSIPALKKALWDDHEKCIRMLRLIEESDMDPAEKEDNLVPLLLQFMNTRQYHLACDVGNSISNLEIHRTVLEMLTAIGKGALQCYKWSASNATDKDIIESIRNQVAALRPPGGSPWTPEEKIYKLSDQHGICRAHLVTYKSDTIKICHKIYIAFTGTRMDNEMSRCDVFNQWFRTNLWAFPTRTSLGWVHSGFNTLANNMLLKILEKVDGNFLPNLEGKYNKVEVFVTGHSMGAAVANLVALEISRKEWCCSCVAFTLATPSVFIGSITIPDNLVLTSFIDKSDWVSIARPFWIYRRIGDTFVLRGDFRLLEAHTKSFEDLFENFTFQKGKERIESYLSN